jgi:sugar lactone lactonase YvrE
VTPDVKVWSATPGLLSEGPRWHEERQELLWVDILGRHMHRGTLSPHGALERVETISVDRHIGAAAPADGGGYVLAAARGSCSSTTRARSASSPNPKPIAPTCG